MPKTIIPQRIRQEINCATLITLIMRFGVYIGMLLFIISNTFSDEIGLGSIIDAIAGESDDETTPAYLYYPSFVPPVISSVLMLGAINYYLKNPTRTEPGNTCESIGDWFSIGGPYGLITTGNVARFLNRSTSLSLAPKLTLSCLLGLPCAIGNKWLHAANRHADESILYFFSRLNKKQQVLATYEIISVLLGHLAQGVLAASSLFKVLYDLLHMTRETRPFWLKVVEGVVEAIFAILIAAAEGNTEVRNILQAMQKEYESANSLNRKQKTLLWFVSIIHSCFTVAGVLELLRQFFSIDNLAWPYRLLIAGGSAAFFLVPNAKGPKAVLEAAFKKENSNVYPARMTFLEEDKHNSEMGTQKSFDNNPPTIVIDINGDHTKATEKSKLLDTSIETKRCVIL